MSFSEVQDSTTYITSASTTSLPFDDTPDTDPVSNDEGSACYDFWTPLLPRDERDTLGVENAAMEELHIGLNTFANMMSYSEKLKLSKVPPLFLDPVMSTTHPGISKANLGYRQSNNYFRKMIEEL